MQGSSSQNFSPFGLVQHENTPMATWRLPLSQALITWILVNNDITGRECEVGDRLAVSCLSVTKSYIILDYQYLNIYYENDIKFILWPENRLHYDAFEKSNLSFRIDTCRRPGLTFHSISLNININIIERLPCARSHCLIHWFSLMCP
jgi:hypothetical protein